MYIYIIVFHIFRLNIESQSTFLKIKASYKHL